MNHSDDIPVKDADAREAAEGQEPSAEAGRDEDQDVEILRSELARLQGELEPLRRQVAEAESRALRARAELDTVRRRLQGDVERAREAGQDSAVLTVLTVFDDLSRALAVANEDDPAKILPGVRAVLGGLERNLSALGLSRVGEAGDPFDPEIHEALTARPAPSPEAANTIAEVFEAGFVKGERLVRPARVVVYQ